MFFEIWVINNNIIEMKGSNACGNDVKVIQVQANPCIIPKLTPVSPSGIVQTINSSSYVLNISSQGVLVQQNISIVQNGAIIPFSYNFLTNFIVVSFSASPTSKQIMVPTPPI